MRKSKLSMAEKYKLLTLRIEWGDYQKIGDYFSITPKQASAIHTTIKTAIRSGRFYTVKKISNVTGEDEKRILELVAFNIKKGIKNAKSYPIIKVKINDIVSSPNIWYANKSGRIFQVTDKITHYEVTDLFKIRKEDCTVITP